MPYTYTKLATPTTIRLIQVMPEKVDDTIVCILHTYDTQQLRQEGQDTKYRALSYRWGNPDTTRSVYLKDPGESEWHEHRVHENLWRFVECVWQLCLFQDCFWTDYFCLDQCSDEEKRQQIPRMSVIYAEATVVIIWLGLSEIEEQHVKYFLGWHKDEYGHVEVPREETFDTVKALWSNEYWRRAWIVQEVTLARSAMILTRSFSIILNDLWEAILETKPLHTAKVIPSPPFWLNYYPLYRNWLIDPGLNDLKELATMDIKSRQMWKLLRDYVSSDYMCKEPDDRLCGFLGLLATPNGFNFIDYKRPYGHVILDAVFEAAADWYPTWIPAILERFAVGQMAFGLTTNANELEEYLNEERTHPRHKELAGLALTAFDAMSLIMTTRGAPQSRQSIAETHEALAHDKSCNIKSEAIFIGITLAFGSSWGWASTLLWDWKSCRYPRLQKQSWRSPWLCNAHWHPIEDHMQEYIRRCDNRPSIEEYMGEYLRQYVRRFQDKPPRYFYMKHCQKVFKSWHNENMSTELYMRVQRLWHSETQSDLGVRRRAPVTREAPCEPGSYFGVGREEACRHAGEHCDGSSMVFEIPHAFFRMTISSGIRLEFFDKDTWTV